MDKKILSKTIVYKGKLDKNNLVDIPAVRQFIFKKKELFLQRYERRYKDFYLDFNDQIDWINKEIMSKLNAYHDIRVIPTNQKAEVHEYKECTLKRNQLNLYDLSSSPDFTTLFIVDAQEDDQLHIEYNDHRAIKKHMIYNLKPNMYFTFNSDLDYYFMQNNHNVPRVILNLNHQYAQ